MKKVYRIGIIPGDGIGQDVVGATMIVLEAINDLAETFQMEFTPMDAGASAVEKYGEPLPEVTRQGIARMDTTLFGAAGSPYDCKVLSGIRFGFELYANVRPIRALPGTKPLQPKADVIIVRENTEGLYRGVGYSDGDYHVNLRIFTRKGMERILHFCFKLAMQKGRKKVTFTHKDNVLVHTDGVMKKLFYEIAGQYPSIQAEDMEIDACAMRMVMKPETLDVVFAENANGDVLSDVGGGIIGGIGMTPGANIGDTRAVFEPVHGSAPKYAGKNVVNPIATLMAAKMMFEYLGQNEVAIRMEKAIGDVLIEGRVRTYDLGGSSSTTGFAEAVAEKIRHDWQPLA
jgi:isocitrate/isopropylmalate dehydrogenase